MKIKIHAVPGTRLVVRTLAGTYHGTLVGHVTTMDMVPYFSTTDAAYVEFFNRVRGSIDHMRYDAGRGRGYEPPPPMPGLFNREVPVSLLLETASGTESISYEHIVSWRLASNDETPA